ncbi:PREDICTED: LOW QUALITY PROTEIN: protein FAM117A, partial [Tauraco erythrolophus]|uniref:LOW QUALITY PROTEIN: protein FAM117A n=1 Tax=Tauraco erythrolophus TaxID=121530 RepID=UPI000523126B
SVPTAAEKTCRPRQPRVRRTSSLDTIVGSYLVGQWPRDAEGASTWCMNDKATQTPVSWHEAEAGKASSSAHKRSASWGSTDHRREIAKLKQQLQRTKLNGRSGKEKEKSSPLQGDHAVLGSFRDSPSGFLSPSPILRLSPCLHRSLEGLNQELEEVFVKEQGDEELWRILDVPDGHRAPAPARREEGSPSPVLAFASSPRPNHSYMFKREPPEGCEKVRAFEETLPPGPDLAFQPSCPDKNKVHFNPTGSAFCPVSLVKPLFPNVGFLFRAFPASSSPAQAPLHPASPQPPP